MSEENEEDSEEAAILLSRLSRSLRHEVQTDIYNRILKSKKLFYLNFSSAFLLELAPRLHEKRYMPEEIILR